MYYEEEILEKFYVLGIAVRTSNLEGKSEHDLAELWADFYKKDIFSSIPNKVSEDIYCVYTDYESDFKGAYTALIGCKVLKSDGNPSALILKEIPTSRYRIYTSKGKLPECVVNTWMHIWQSDIPRKYTADFEVYGSKAQNPTNVEVKTYLSIV